MPSLSDYAYFRQREQECREKAANASDPVIGRIHLEFADRYNVAALRLGERARNAA